MYKRFVLNSNGFVAEERWLKTPYAVYLENTELGKMITEEQKRNIAEKLFNHKSKQVFEQTAVAENSSIQKPIKMRLQNKVSSSNGNLEEFKSKASSYQTFLHHQGLGRRISQDQRNEIMDKLNKSKPTDPSFKSKDAKCKPTSIEKPSTMRSVTSSKVVVKTDSLYKMSLQFILN